MKIEKHKLLDAEQIATPNFRNGPIVPKFIVMHYTAGTNIESTINTFLKPESKVSSHLVLGRDGRVVQMADFDKVTWHAGPSNYQGYSGLNSHSIGIEIVNVGFLRVGSTGNYIDASGKNISTHVVGDTIQTPYPKAGSGTFFWQTYAEKQLAKLDEIVQAILDEYDILDIVSHEEIDTRGWKVDPGPAFPMRRYKNMLNGDRNSDVLKFVVVPNNLNVRSGPGQKFKVLTELNRGEVITVDRLENGWAKLDESDYTEGWVHASFIKRVR